MLSALGVLSTEHSVQSNPSALSALSTEMHHQNKTLSTKCCHPHGHSVLSTSTVCAPALRNDATVGRQSQAASGYAISIDRSGSLHVGATAAARLPCAHDTGQSMWAADSISGKKGFFFAKGPLQTA